MRLTVRDLIEYLNDQNPDAKICYFDSKVGDYIQMEDYLFKKVSNAKKEYQKNLENVFSEIEDEEERRDNVEKEMKNYFKYVNMEDILIGLENGIIRDNLNTKRKNGNNEY